MKGLTIPALAVLWLGAAAASAHDQAADRAAILAVIDQAFAAVASGDPDDWRAIQLAEGTTLSFRPDGEGGQAMRIESNEEAIQREPTDDAYLERWLGEPTVMIRGPIAVVWGEYEFFINGERSHCGVDSVDLVKVDGEWKIANFMWTVEPDGCPEPPAAAHDISGVWKLVELHDWNPDGEDEGSLGSQAPGLFVYTPEGKLSLHIMTEHDRPLIDGETTHAERGEIFGPYIGYFGTYSVDYEAMVVTHHIEGAKSPNRIGRAAERPFRFEDGDLVLDFTTPDGWRFYRRLQRVESFQSHD